MQVVFNNPVLKEVYLSGKSRRLHSDVIRSYIKVINFLEDANDIRDVYDIGSLHFKKLNGNRSTQYSIRLNKGRRLICTVEDGESVQVISLEGITNHYQ